MLRQGKPKNVIIHTDRVSQYLSKDYIKAIEGYGAKRSYSAKGNPYDNAVIKSFHAILKKEEIYQNIYRSYEKANLAIFEFIESWYNNKRIHSSIGYLTPNEFEKLAA
ncbi:integrase core domain-containing protein [Crassaminicella indica]|uniref:integrase core domain-containing protein n=1 Tax=Crassaminicella indica TaxID=2855394 RepID=UPI003B830B2C